MTEHYTNAERLRGEATKVRTAITRKWADLAHEGRTLTTAEAGKIAELTERADELELAAEVAFSEAQRSAKAAGLRIQTPRTRGSGDDPYTRGERSFIGDVVAARLWGDSAAAARIADHDEQRREVLAARGETRLVTSTGAGAFVPDIYAGSQYEGAPSTGRPYIDQIVGVSPLPDFGSEVLVPTFDTLPTTAAQVAQGSAIADSSPTAGTATAAVITMAGGVDLSRFLVERSDPGFDGVVFEQLNRSIAQTIETAALSGAGSTTFKGALAYGTADGASVIAIGTADVAAGGTAVLDKLAEGISTLTSGDYAEAAVFVMHPRRWMQIASFVDGDKRPYVAPVAPASGRDAEDVAGYGRVVGYIYGVPVTTSGGVSTSFDSNRDRILLANRRHARYWESGGPFRLTVDLSGGDALTVRLSAYQYAAYTVTRPSGLVIFNGDGLTNPFA